MSREPNWGESPETSTRRPMREVVPLPGALLVAMVEASFDWTADGRKQRFRVRFRWDYPKANVRAVCLGQRASHLADGAMQPCTCLPVEGVEATGEDGLDAARAAHPAPHELKASNTQHVIALFAPDLIDPIGYAARLKAYKERVAAFSDPKVSAVERLAMMQLWGTTPTPETPAGPEPKRELVGLLGYDLPLGRNGPEYRPLKG